MEGDQNSNEIEHLNHIGKRVSYPSGVSIQAIRDAYFMEIGSSRLLIHSIAVEQLTSSAPPYICEILLEAELFLLWEIGQGFVLKIKPKTRNQALILLQQESVTAILQSLTQVFSPDVLRLQYDQISRDIPVRDFLSFCDSL